MVRAERQKREANRKLEAEAEAAGVSLSSFIKAAWHVLEPAAVYKHGWHIDAISDHLKAVTDGQVTRLIINVPPGTMKSLTVGVFWPCWEWGPLNLAHLRTIAASYKESLARRDNIKARRLVQSDWFQARWGHQFSLMRDQNATLKFENNRTGFRQAASFESLTGERGNRVILDDPLSVAQAKSDQERTTARETYLEAVPNRLVDPELSAIVLVMQRLHEQDTTGIALSKNLGYEHLMLPMEYEAERRCYTVVKPSHFDAEPIKARYDAEKQIWYQDKAPVPPARAEYVAKSPLKTVYPQDPRIEDGELLFAERFSRQTVERDKISLGQMGHAGQNQQRPAPREGGLFKRSAFRIIKAAPGVAQWVRGWDLAADDEGKGARTAGVKVGKTRDGRFVVSHCVAQWEGPAGVRDLIKTTTDSDGISCRVSLPQDPGQAGKDQAQQMIKMLAGYTVRASRETGDKVTRAEPFAAQVEAGNVDLVEGVWNEEFLDELEMFPNGKLKDIVDAASRAFSECALGAGRVFDPDMAELEIPPMALPGHWPKSYALAADAGRVVALWGAWDEFGACHIYAESEFSSGDHANLGAAVKARGDWVRGVLAQTSQMNLAEGKEYKAALRRHSIYVKPDDKSPDAGIVEVKSTLAKGFVKIFSNLERLKDAYRTYYMDETGQPAEPSLYMDAMRSLVASGRKRAQVKQSSFNTSSGRGPTTLSGF